MKPDQQICQGVNTGLERGVNEAPADWNS